MQRINGSYLYDIGSQIHPLTELRADMPLNEVYLPLLIAEGALAPLLQQSIYNLKTSRENGFTLLGIIQELREKVEKSQNDSDVFAQLDAYRLQSAFQKFEAVVSAELSISPLYLVMQKGAFDIDMLVLNGISLFPSELPAKVPECVSDIQQATKCLAFELPTACGFHLHRANESVLHRYYDAVTKCAERPKNRNMGEYLNELDKQGKGEKKVIAALRDLKDLHRNPLVHPENALETAEEAIALLGGVQAVITHMLKEIPMDPRVATEVFDEIPDVPQKIRPKRPSKS